MRKVLRFLWSIFEFLIIAYVILITSFVLCKNKYGYTQFGSYTFDSIDLTDESNIEDTKEGDLLLVRNSNDIKIGDRIYYYAARNEAYIIRSNYVTAIESDDYSALYTIQENGENITIASSRVLGKYVNTYPKLGGVLAILENRVGFLFLVLLPIMIVFIYQVYEFVMILRYEEIEKDDVKNEEKKITNSDVEIL